MGEMPFPSDGVPTFKLMVEFCNDACDYMEKNPNGIIVAHSNHNSKSNLLISVFLLYTDVISSHKEALYKLSKKRNANQTINYSQRRYAGYFERYMKEYVLINQPLYFGDRTLLFSRARFTPIWDPDKHPEKKQFIPLLRIYCNGEQSECDDNTDSSMNFLPAINPAYKDVIAPDGTGGKPLGIPVYGDVKFEVFNDLPTPPDHCCTFWIHIDFVLDGYVCLKKFFIDGLANDINNDRFPENFKIELFFLSQDR